VIQASKGKSWRKIKRSGPSELPEILFMWMGYARCTHSHPNHGSPGGVFLKELSSSEKLELLSKIMTEHQSLKARVKQLGEQLSRTSAEQIEMSQLKKRKVLMKDKIQLLRRN
jgi:uncharacterized protein YdcH (DUF465 family)